MNSTKKPKTSDLFQVLKTHGLLRTARIVLSTIEDRLRSLLSGHWQELVGSAQIDSVSEKNFDRLTDYQPTRSQPFVELMKELKLDPELGRFVDFGSGKGRVLRLMRELGFKKVRGIEFSESLARQSKGIAGAETLHMDFSDYLVEKDDVVFYFYDPAEGAPLLQAMTNIGNSLKQHPRKAMVIYHNNLLSSFPEDLRHALRPKRVDAKVIQGNSFFVIEL